MNSTKEKCVRVIRILLMIAVIVLSLALPQIWQSSYDARIENKLEKFSANVTTYEMQYKSFSQKLELLAACEVYEIKLEKLAVEDYAEVMSAEQLAKIVREQLEELEQNIGFYDFPTEQITAESMKKRVKYVMYTLTDQINISGIDFWEVTYQTDELEISLKLDSEFYKIYGLQVSYGSVYDEDWNLWDYFEVDNGYGKSAEGYGVPPYSSEIYDIMLSGLAFYWGINDISYNWMDIADVANVVDDVDERWIGVIEFFEGVDEEILAGQTDEKAEDTSNAQSLYDVDEEYTYDSKIDEKYGYESDGATKPGRLYVEQNIFNSNNRGFGLRIQK